MPDAVIVSALRTPIGTAMKGTLRDTDAYQLAEHVVGSGRSRSRSRVQIDDVILGEGLYGGGVVARHAAITAGLTSVPGLAAEPALRRGPGRRAERRGQHPCRAWTSSIIAGGVNSASTSPRFKRRAGARRDGRLVPAHPPGPARRAQHGHVDHRRLERRGQGRRDREEMDEWALGSHRKAIQAIDEGRFKARDRPHRDAARPVRRRRAPAPRHQHREDWPRSSRCIPRSRASRSPRATPAAPTTAPRVLAIASDRLGLPALAHHPVVGVRRRRPGVNRPGAGRGDPESACPRRLSHRPTSTCSRSTRRSRRCASPPSSCSTSIPTRSTSAAAAARSAIPVAATGARMLVTLVHELRRRGGGIGVAAMCAGGGMGSATVIEVPAP